MSVRAQLTLVERPSEIERTPNEYAAAMEPTGMRVYERELELRELLSSD